MKTETSQSMIHASASALTPTTLAETEHLAEVMSKSDLIPSRLRGNKANVLFVIGRGLELGIGPMAALRGMHVFEDKRGNVNLVIDAGLMHGVTLRSAFCEYFRRIKSDAKSAIFETKRIDDGEPQRYEYTIKTAEIAGLTRKHNWQANPEAMLMARCRATLARIVYPDLLAGLYLPDEIETASEAATPPRSAFAAPAAPVLALEAEPEPEVADAEIVAEEPDPANRGNPKRQTALEEPDAPIDLEAVAERQAVVEVELMTSIENAATVAELVKLRGACADCGDDIKDRYNARRSALKAAPSA